MAASVCVCCWLAGPVFSSLMLWLSGIREVCEAEITSSLLVMEDTRKMIRQQDCHCGCVKFPNARLRSYF